MKGWERHLPSENDSDFLSSNSNVFDNSGFIQLSHDEETSYNLYQDS